MGCGLRAAAWSYMDESTPAREEGLGQGRLGMRSVREALLCLDCALLPHSWSHPLRPISNHVTREEHMSKCACARCPTNSLACAPRTGKTQLCHTLCVTTQLPVADGGGAGKVRRRPCASASRCLAVLGWLGMQR